MYTAMTKWSTALLAQNAPDAADAVKVQSVLDFLQKGGPVMIPIGICSLVALAVMIERMIMLRRRHVIPPRFLAGIKKTMSEANGDLADALEYCRANGSSIANILAAGIRRLSEPFDVLERHVRDAGGREVVKLRKHLRALSVLASVAPLLGLLGTIFGMIEAFQTVATSGEALGKAELLAKGIYEAMITTAAGLSLAIPVLIAYHWLSAKVDGLVGEMDRLTVDFVEEHTAGTTDVTAGPKLRPTEPESHTDTDDKTVAAMASA